MSDEEQRYRCPKCGWVGTEDDMEADHYGEPAEEVWSNWICLGCGTWWQLKDYEKVGPIDQPTTK